MSFSPSLYARTFPPASNGDEQARLLTYVSGPGTPAQTDTTPAHIGQEYFDTANRHFYKAVDLDAGPDGWKRLTSDNP